jgi:hypothetical protein
MRSQPSIDLALSLHVGLFVKSLRWPLEGFIFTKRLVSLMLLSGLLFSRVAQADAYLEGPFSLSALPQFFADFRARVETPSPLQSSARRETECRPIAELPQAILCISYTHDELVDLFSRIALFVEGNFGFPRGQIAMHTDSRLRNYKDRVWAIDLNGSDINHFFKRVADRCRGDERKKRGCLSPFENSVLQNLARPLTFQSGTYVILGVSINFEILNRPYLDLAHEILHAQYFLQPNYSKTVREFWKSNVSKREKKSFLETAKQFYNSKDKDLMANEYQAYLLSRQGMGYINDFCYEPQLRQKLMAAGVAPLEIQYSDETTTAEEQLEDQQRYQEFVDECAKRPLK